MVLEPVGSENTGSEKNNPSDFFSFRRLQMYTDQQYIAEERQV